MNSLQYNLNASDELHLHQLSATNIGSKFISVAFQCIKPVIYMLMCLSKTVAYIT